MDGAGESANNDAGESNSLPGWGNQSPNNNEPDSDSDNSSTESRKKNNGPAMKVNTNYGEIPKDEIIDGEKN